MRKWKSLGRAKKQNKEQSTLVGWPMPKIHAKSQQFDYQFSCSCAVLIQCSWDNSTPQMHTATSQQHTALPTLQHRHPETNPPSPSHTSWPMLRPTWMAPEANPWLSATSSTPLRWKWFAPNSQPQSPQQQHIFLFKCAIKYSRRWLRAAREVNKPVAMGTVTASSILLLLQQVEAVQRAQATGADFHPYQVKICLEIKMYSSYIKWDRSRSFRE